MDGNSWACLLLSRVLFQALLVQHRLIWKTVCGCQFCNLFSWTALWSSSSLLPTPAYSSPYLCSLSPLMHAEYRKQTNGFPKALLSCHSLTQKSIRGPYCHTSLYPRPHLHAIFVATRYILSHLEAFAQAVSVWNIFCRLSPSLPYSADPWCSSLYITSFRKSRDMGAPHMYCHSTPWLL